LHHLILSFLTCLLNSISSVVWISFSDERFCQIYFIGQCTNWSTSQNFFQISNQRDDWGLRRGQNAIDLRGSGKVGMGWRLGEWENERMREWENERMREWESERMREWENERLGDWNLIARVTWGLRCCEIARLRCREIVELRNCGIAELRNCGIARWNFDHVQDCKMTF
jgi:hypothetical protein